MIENIGVPFPTEASYLLAVDVVQHGYSYWLMMVLLTAAHTIGATIAFGLGWWGEGWLTSHLQQRAGYRKASQAIHRWYASYGQPTTFAARFIGYVRPWSSLIAGFAHIDFAPFLLWTLTGSFLFNVMAMAVGMSMWDWWFRFGLWFKVGAVILFLISFGVIFFFNHYYNQREKNSSGTN